MDIRVLAALAVLFAVSGRAETITFNSAYPAKFDTQFNPLPYTEGSFTVSQFSGHILFVPITNGNVGVQGDQTVDYYQPEVGGTAAVALTSGGLFTYAGLDAGLYIGTSLGALGYFNVTGYRDGQLVGTDRYGVAPSYTTYTPEVATNLKGVVLDQLRIQLPGEALEGGYSFAFAADNINVTPLTAVTPEPSSLVLFGTGLLGLFAALYRGRVESAGQ